MNVALYRNVDYINNKIALHVGSALFNGFTFWMIGSAARDQQEVLFAVFNFICKSRLVQNLLRCD
jgi:ABC-type multidrug transport system permease subunit